MKKIAVFLVVIFIFLLPAYNAILRDYTNAPSTIYTNANILTLEEEIPTAAAMLVEDGKIKAIGSEEEIMAMKKPIIKVVDLKGATVLPGFIDVHTHAALSAVMAEMVDLSGFKHQNNQEVWAHLKEVASQKEAGEWIVCKGIDPVLVQDLKSPNKQFLDDIAPNNPVVIFAQSLHSYWLNSKAFDLVGITKETPDPSELSYYEKNDAGELSGLVVEQEAFLPIMEVLKNEVFTNDILLNAIAETLRAYAKNGNTTIVSTGLTIKDKKGLRLFEHLSAQTPTFFNKLLEKTGFLAARQPNPRHFIYIRHDMPHLMPEKDDHQDDFYDIIGVKHWYDGSPYIGSMYLNKPYLSSPLAINELHIPAGHKGKALIETEALENFIKQYQEKGWQIAIHTQGDAAITEVLNAFEKINQELPLTEKRHRLEHCLLFPKSSIEQMKSLNITPSYHVNHIYYYGDALKKSIIGARRAEAVFPIASTQAKEVPYSLHADQPMFESQPFRLIRTAVERRTKTGDILGDNEKITIMDGLKALTINAAWQIHKEDKIGSIKPGKYADFVVIDKNPLETPPAKLDSIQILQTFVNGNEVL